MAVYEHLYGAYEGASPSARSRFLVIPRYALGEVFKSKLLVTIFISCFVYPLVASILVYLHHNSNALALLHLDVQKLLPIDASFFQTFVQVQGAFAFILTVIVAPPLVSRDLSNNALPLYLCRPLSRAEYILGKMSVVVFMLSFVTWIPGLLLFFFQASLTGFDWLSANLWMSGAIFSGFAVWIILLSLLSLAVSSLLKWRVMASGALVGIFFVPSAFGTIVNQLFLTRAGNLMSLWAMMNSIWRGLFGIFERQIIVSDNRRAAGMILMEPPLWVSWLVAALVCLVCVRLLARKVRAYEVIK